MSYTPTTWQAGDTITAAKLNHMEDGITANDGEIVDLKSAITDVADALTYVQSKNLYNKDDADVVNGYYLAGSGLPTNADASLMTSGFIPVKNNKTIYMTQGVGVQANMQRLAIYDKSKTLLAITGAWFGNSYEINNANVAYMRISFPNSWTNVMVSYDAPSYYEAYFAPYYECADNGVRDELLYPSKVIDCWGDSLTFAYGYTGYPTLLQNALGNSYEVVNFGVGGESTRTIAGRQGGMKYILQPSFAIPGNTNAVEVTMKSDDGGEVAPIMSNVPRDMGVNPCSVYGIDGTLSWSNDGTANHWYFTRSKVGGAHGVYRPIPLQTSGALREHHTNIIWMGQNGGFDNDIDLLITQHRKMIDHSKSDNYLVLGITSLSATTGAEMERKMFNAFGRHYINLREYLSAYGLRDNGLTATATDEEYMSEGKVPPQLLSDTVHGNNYMYKTVGYLVYLRGAELGYWDYDSDVADNWYA